MNLKNLPFKTVLRLAKDLSGMTLEELSEKTGIHLSQLQRYFSEEDYYPSPPKIVTISKALNTKLLAQWFMVQVEGIENEAFKGYSDVVEEIEKVTREIVKALEDGEVNEMERQRILKAAAGAYSALEGLINALQKGGVRK
ncbi:MAG: hypothetical protein DSY42_04480 [Aquifex sp.]|nr:MAG: hypothetical protein DSY42_04480 [Aquifex sp.]